MMEILTQKKRGFSLVEMMVAVAIMGMIALVGFPMMESLHKRALFDREAQALIDAVGDVRNHALTKKKCKNGDSAFYWEIHFFSDKDASFPNRYKIICGGITAILEEEKIFEIGKISELQKKTSSSFSEVGNGNARIHFLTKEATAKFIDGSKNTPSHWFDSLRLVFERIDSAQAKTLCMHRLQGFLSVVDSKDMCP